MSIKTMQAFSDMIISKIEQMDENSKSFPWVKPWSTLDTKYRNLFTKRAYSGLHNILSCMLSGFSDCRFATFNQVKNAGGKVKKGSAGTMLIAWNFVKKENKKTGKEESIPFARTHYVFNVEQIEGIEIEEINKIDESMTENKDLIKLLEDLGVDYVHEKRNNAAYIPSLDQIAIPHVGQYKELGQWEQTLLHELVHWTANRVKRDCSKYHFDAEAKAMEELVAELGGMFLSMKLGLDGWQDENNLKYVKHWKDAVAGKNGIRFIYKACKLAEEAANYILKTSGIVDESENKEEGKEECHAA